MATTGSAAWGWYLAAHSTRTAKVWLRVRKRQSQGAGGDRCPTVGRAGTGAEHSPGRHAAAPPAGAWPCHGFAMVLSRYGARDSRRAGPSTGPRLPARLFPAQPLARTGWGLGPGGNCCHPPPWGAARRLPETSEPDTVSGSQALTPSSTVVMVPAVRWLGQSVPREGQSAAMVDGVLSIRAALVTMASPSQPSAARREPFRPRPTTQGPAMCEGM